jgi:RNA recognition motif-containing protein
MNIYCGNLPYEISETELRTAFEAFGEVESAKIINDAYSGRSKGFGFVEMSDDAAGSEAIEKLNGSAMGGRNVKINEARPRPGGGGGGPRRY